MRAVVFVLLIVFSLVATVVLTIMGMEYVELGHGIHPALMAIGVFVAGGIGTWAMGTLEELCTEG